MPKHFSSEENLIRYYSDKSHQVWSHYLTMPNILISVAGATTLVFFNAIKLSDIQGYSKVGFAVAAVVFSGLALIYTIAWRIAAQHFYEYETYGASDDLQEYFRICGLDEYVTSTVGKNSRRRFYRLVYRSSPVLALLSMLIAWGLLLAFICINT